MKEKNLREKLEVNQKKPKEKTHIEEPTLKQREKVKIRKGQEKKADWPFVTEEETKIQEDASSPPGGTPGEEEVFTQESLEEICKVLAATTVAIWTVFDKEIEGLDEKEKDLVAPPMARCAIKHQVQKWVKDELALALAIGTIVSKRIIAKKEKHDKDHNRKEGEGKDHVNS